LPSNKTVEGIDCIHTTGTDYIQPPTRLEMEKHRTLDEEMAYVKYFSRAFRAAKSGNHQAEGWSNSAYQVSKVGVSALSFIQQRAFDSDPREDLVVNAVHPGYVDTDMTSHRGPLTIEQGKLKINFVS
jgi:Dehydrogenases with different specificities (related to short-chain alcohol dehydrogenases)